jgi:predicted DNA-binding protein (MmcQ/YjbR family)
MAKKTKGDTAPLNPVTQQRHAAVCAHALSFPEAWEDHPWGETAMKVRKKVFVFVWASDAGITVTTKLPFSHEAVLMFPFASPTGYGLGRSGWVSSKFAPEDDFPLPLVKEWIDESFRAIAPKSLSSQLATP